MNLSSHLIPRLKCQFAAHEPRFEPGSRFCIFPPKHSEFGELSIRDDGHEVTVECGRFTHVHFWGNGSGSSEEANEITADVLSFLKGTFADQIIFWVEPGGTGGCYGTKAQGPKPEDVVQFVWSGPLLKE